MLRQLWHFRTWITRQPVGSSECGSNTSRAMPEGRVPHVGCVLVGLGLDVAWQREHFAAKPFRRTRNTMSQSSHTPGGSCPSCTRPRFWPGGVPRREARRSSACCSMLLTNNGAFDVEPDWQPIPFSGYPRPQGASPLRVSLVPAYVKCTGTNRIHGPPLAHPSCAPPVQYSHQVTVGSPDANGQGAKSIGSVMMASVIGDPGTTGIDEADVRLDTSITDVRNKPLLTDYQGELRVTVSLRITDRDNATAPGGGVDTATVADSPSPSPCLAPVRETRRLARPARSPPRRRLRRESSRRGSARSGNSARCK